MSWRAGLMWLFTGWWAASFGLADEPVYDAADRGHWSLVPRGDPQPPVFDAPADQAWLATEIDAFILARLHEAGLRPAPPANRTTLIRRLCFDLTGLPPSPEEVEAFVHDPSPNAYETLVERLLASPHYGERWARHWLDVVRYAETEGFEYDNYLPGAWRYRDYVIDSLNADKPYDQFVREQVAGDELAPDNPTMLIAAGFHRLGPVRRNAGNQEVAGSRNEVLTEMTNTISSVFLGLTVGCARCHDHMFDPIRQKDYYQLEAFLAATHERNVPLVDAEQVTAWQARTDQIKAEMKQISKSLGTAGGETREALETQLKELEAQLPPPLPTICTVEDRAAERTAIHVLQRGNWNQPIKPVGMRVLGVLLPEGAAELPADTPAARARLAEWLTSPGHPLTARVIVNRVWQNHFGCGLVDTPNDFGVNGDPPSHPELLDWLANRFVAGGWRLKSLHRLIVLSNTYRQAASSADASHALAVDPSNRLLWRANRRRLQAEEIRDAMLAVSGKLNLKAGGASVVTPVESDLVNLLYKPSQWSVTADRQEHFRRSIYLLAKRNLRLPFMEVFDQPDAQTSCARRESSTHAPQALELLNGQLANELADALAERLLREAGSEPDRQIALAFRLVASRLPNEAEAARAHNFLRAGSLRELALAMLNLNAFLYVD
ncbi:MAG TPA: DUF1549 and DUF1553 domain-containing protein [Pirellulales bacterium]|nr:DUF1549 and DUF1553 domain-containing protein [Pirellulales bacterium]